MTGGYYKKGYEEKFLSSTEIQVTRSSEWKEVESYPLSGWGLKGAKINNEVYMTGQNSNLTYLYIRIIVIVGGGNDKEKIWYNNIFKFDAETEQWTLVGKMKEKKAHHAVSVVNRANILQNCL